MPNYTKSLFEGYLFFWLNKGNELGDEACFWFFYSEKSVC